jgi:hypothetical protein
MVVPRFPVSVDLFDGSLVGLLTVAVAVAVTVGTDGVVTPPSLLAANNTAPISSAARTVAASARDPMRLFFAGV